MQQLEERNTYTPTNIPHVRGNCDPSLNSSEGRNSVLGKMPGLKTSSNNSDAALTGQGKYQNRTCESLLPKLSSILTKEYDWQLSLKLSLRLSSHS